MTGAPFAAFDRLYAEQVVPGAGSVIAYSVAAPRWQFLCWLADTKDVLLHGSGARDVKKFEPRQAHDVGEFGARRAVYAAGDGIWPMFFAIANRPVVSSLVNACAHVIDGDRPGPYYYFSVNADALSAGAWRDGCVYVLPRATFEQEPDEQWHGCRVAGTQWASPVAVRPLARLDVRPDDFPFLADVHGHDHAVVERRAAADPDDFPWLADPT